MSRDDPGASVGVGVGLGITVASALSPPETGVGEGDGDGVGVGVGLGGGVHGGVGRAVGVETGVGVGVGGGECVGVALGVGVGVAQVTVKGAAAVIVAESDEADYFPASVPVPEAATAYESVMGNFAPAARWNGKRPDGDPSLWVNVYVPEAPAAVPFTIEPLNFMVAGQEPV